MAFPAVFDIATLDGMNGFQIRHSANQFGGSMDSLGDFNGDGRDDLALGCSTTPPALAHIIWGRSNVQHPFMSYEFDSSNSLNLTSSSSYFGRFVHSVGDFNRDGKDGSESKMYFLSCDDGGSYWLLSISSEGGAAPDVYVGKLPDGAIYEVGGF